jgi:phosphoesterase RecJ-like protein
VFSEKQDGRVEIGLRARPGYDVSGVALSLGGGGHPQAAGCTVAGPLATVEARVLPMLLAASREICPVMTAS